MEHTKKHMAFRTHKETHGLWNTQRSYKSTKLIQEANTKIQKHIYGKEHTKKHIELIEHTSKHMDYRTQKESRRA